MRMTLLTRSIVFQVSPDAVFFLRKKLVSKATYDTLWSFAHIDTTRARYNLSKI